MSAKSKPSLGKVLVIGGNGFVGSHIVDLLRSECDASISILSRKATKDSDPFQDVQYFDADISSIQELLPIFESIRPDVVIHTVSPPSLKSTAALFQKVNVEGTKCLLEASEKTGVKAFIYTSSSTVIKREADMSLDNADETWPVFTGPEQKNPYLRTKAIAETMVLAANRKTSMLTCALRGAAIFGERDKTSFPGMVERYNKGSTQTQIGDNTNTFDFTYVRNHAWAYILAASALLSASESGKEVSAAKRVDGEVFYTTNYEPRVCFWDFPRLVYAALAQEVGETYVSKPKVMSKRSALIIAWIMTWLYWFVGREPQLTAPVVEHCCRTAYFNNEKARSRLGYRLRWSTEEGIRRSAKWAAGEGLIKSKSGGKKQK